MNAPITFTATMACWISKGYNQRRLLDAMENGNAVEAINAMTIYGAADKKDFSDSIRVGEADVTVRVIPKDEQTALAVQALQQQLAEERVKWHQRQEAILAEISKLSAIEYVQEA
jgi:hypothetical protein